MAAAVEITTVRPAALFNELPACKRNFCRLSISLPVRQNSSKLEHLLSLILSIAIYSFIHPSSQNNAETSTLSR